MSDIDKILDELSDASASRGWLDCKSGSENTYPRNDLVSIAKKAIKQEIIKGQLQILYGFRRRDFALEVFYEQAILERIAELQSQLGEEL